MGMTKKHPFWQGVANILNIWPVTETPKIMSDEEANACNTQALKEDWEQIERDICGVVGNKHES
jgi:hypothetical protein